MLPVSWFAATPNALWNSPAPSPEPTAERQRRGNEGVAAPAIDAHASMRQPESTNPSPSAPLRLFMLDPRLLLFMSPLRLTKTRSYRFTYASSPSGEVKCPDNTRPAIAGRLCHRPWIQVAPDFQGRRVEARRPSDFNPC